MKIRTDNQFYQACKHIRPMDLDALQSTESKIISQWYKSHGYWLSEMWLYPDEVGNGTRKMLKSIVRDLDKSGKLDCCQEECSFCVKYHDM